MERSAIISSILVLLGLGHFGSKLIDALQARERVSIVDGKEFRSPETSLNTGLPILQRSLSLEEILRRKKLKRPKDNSKTNGCPFGPGISVQGKETYVLLKRLENGRLVEIPERGVFLIDQLKAEKLAAPGKCQALRSKGNKQP